MGYDADSGLVYTETMMSAKPCNCLSIHQSHGAGLVPVIHTRNQSARSMQDMVTTHILRNLKGLRTTTLAVTLGGNPLLLDKLWAEIKKRSLDTLHVWQTFAQIEGVSIDQVRHWKWQCPRCLFSRLPQMLQLADSPSLAWVTDLTLEDRITSHDLLQVSKLRNVRNLHFYGNTKSNKGFTDAVFRSWADAAQQSHAFPELESVTVDAPRYNDRGISNITHWSLGQLWKFPALAIFRLRGFRIDDKDMMDQQRIGSFVRKRKKTCSRSQKVRDRYVLELTIGVPRPEKTYDVDDVVSYKRDWTSWVPTAEEAAPWYRQDAVEDVRPTSKRRKVKDGRAQRLAESMGGWT
ncbi:hypothetical protein LTR85_000841 [Meristemomyces frigidus]|nr:hypothetical protein LTR85_000841 [Meristemomyces frigidus]